MRTAAARAAAAMQPCKAVCTGKSHSAFARRLRRQSRGASGGRDSTVSPRAAHDNTAALLHIVWQIERRIRAAPPGALTSLSRFPFRAQAMKRGRYSSAVCAKTEALQTRILILISRAALIPTLKAGTQRAELDAIKIAFELVRQEKAALLAET